MIKRAFTARGFPVYANLEAAIRTLAHLYKFGHRRKQE
jgi:acyl-CoA synthetase (NDP forming)